MLSRSMLEKKREGLTRQLRKEYRNLTLGEQRMDLPPFPRIAADLPEPAQKEYERCNMSPPLDLEACAGLLAEQDRQDDVLCGAVMIRRLARKSANIQGVLIKPGLADRLVRALDVRVRAKPKGSLPQLVLCELLWVASLLTSGSQYLVHQKLASSPQFLESLSSLISDPSYYPEEALQLAIFIYSNLSAIKQVRQAVFRQDSLLAKLILLSCESYTSFVDPEHRSSVAWALSNFVALQEAVVTPRISPKVLGTFLAALSQPDLSNEYSCDFLNGIYNLYYSSKTPQARFDLLHPWQPAHVDLLLSFLKPYHSYEVRYKALRILVLLTGSQCALPQTCPKLDAFDFRQMFHQCDRRKVRLFILTTVNNLVSQDTKYACRAAKEQDWLAFIQAALPDQASHVREELALLAINLLSEPAALSHAYQRAYQIKLHMTALGELKHKCSDRYQTDLLSLLYCLFDKRNPHRQQSIKEVLEGGGDTLFQQLQLECGNKTYEKVSVLLESNFTELGE